ncbi:MarR family transcriptional regulator [Novosphingobium sp.]|uniref:MarR family transcriptional regulator n=1 Tax=Novosphingobium sp. TaxID=1874826 RepID=UPI001809E26A|nr:MarR family transcriptional regulator [Novosphingobium sp.]
MNIANRSNIRHNGLIHWWPNMRDFGYDEQELVEELCSAIAALPGASAHPRMNQPRSGSRYEPDGLLDVHINQSDLAIVVEAKRELFPRDVRQQIWLLRDYLDGMDGPAEKVAMLVAGAVSRGAREILQQEKIGYFDPGGSLFIPSTSAYVLIDRPPPKKAVRMFGAIFQGQRARVVQAVIEAAPNWVSVKDLAEATGVSAATTSETLTEMERRDWLEVDGAGPAKTRRLRERALVLDEWARLIAAQKPPQIERYYVPANDAGEIARRLEDACRDAGAQYAITAEAAAQVYAPYLSSISQLKCRLQAGRVQHDVLSRLDARSVSEGWNFGVIAEVGKHDVAVGERLNGIAYAPIVQIYLDLLQGSGRASEMADHFRSEQLSG